MATYLLTADVHLGRRSAGFESDPEASTRAVWLRLCTEARARSVEAVLVAGDLVDAAAAYLYALDAVEEGLNILGGIPVIAVAGNHDAATLHRIAKANSNGIRFFGADRWEAEELPGGLRVVGRSFASEEQATSLFADARPEVDGRTVGMVHGEFAAGSRYHSLRADDLRGAALWLLGHIHRPHGDANWRFPGSPQALDFGETGPHGAMLAHWNEGRLETEELPLSTVRYDLLPITLDAAANRETFEEAIAAWWAEARRPGLRARVRLQPKGMTGLTSAEIESWRFEMPEGLALDKFDFREMRPLIDLPALAKGAGARSALARFLLALDEPGFEEGEFASLGRKLAAKAAEETASKIRYRLLPETVTPLDWREAARSAALRMLEACP